MPVSYPQLHAPQPQLSRSPRIGLGMEDQQTSPWPRVLEVTDSSQHHRKDCLTDTILCPFTTSHSENILLFLFLIT